MGYESRPSVELLYLDGHSLLQTRARVELIEGMTYILLQYRVILY